MDHYYHAHRVVSEKCKGHRTCLRNCPTEAIRVRNGKAVFSEELCIDCGICINVCPSGAVEPISDPLKDITQFKYRVAVPDPVLYSQFSPDIHPYVIHLALLKIGFHKVVDLNTSATAVGEATARYISEHPEQVPLISSHCPTIVRLIQVRYPDLVELISPIDVPREVTAREIRKTLPAELDIPSEDIGIIYISPCPAKIVSMKQPADKEKSWYDGAVSITDMFTILYPSVIQIAKNFNPGMVPEDFNFTSGWAVLGGITASKGTESWLAVSGLNHVMRIFDDIENSRLSKIDFVEAEACMLGCVGGPFFVESPYVARSNFMKQMERYHKEVPIDKDDLEQKMAGGDYMLENRILPRPTRYLETDLLKSIRRMREKERIYQKLMQVDCGLCGSPNCMAFAEDVVRGEASLTDCVFLGGPAQVGKEILASRRNLETG